MSMPVSMRTKHPKVSIGQGYRRPYMQYKFMFDQLGIHDYLYFAGESVLRMYPYTTNASIWLYLRWVITLHYVQSIKFEGRFSNFNKLFTISILQFILCRAHLYTLVVIVQNVVLDFLAFKPISIGRKFLPKPKNIKIKCRCQVFLQFTTLHYFYTLLHGK